MVSGSSLRVVLPILMILSLAYNSDAYGQSCPSAPSCNSPLECPGAPDPTNYGDCDPDPCFTVYEGPVISAEDFHALGRHASVAIDDTSPARFLVAWVTGSYTTPDCTNPCEGCSQGPKGEGLKVSG